MKDYIPEMVNGCAECRVKIDRAKMTKQAKQIKQLEAELHRKEKALAEAAALLVLQKKVRAIWEETEDAKSIFDSAEK